MVLFYCLKQNFLVELPIIQMLKQAISLSNRVKLVDLILVTSALLMGALEL